jgi:hypothetical protein
MAILELQTTPVQSGTTSLTLTFGSAPAIGNVVVVPGITYRNGAVFALTCGDNRGNTYNLDADTGDSNGARGWIFVAHNIATGSPFTITLTATAGSQIEAAAIEFSGFGATNPLVGVGTMANGSATNPTVSTGATGAPEVAVIACLASFCLNFPVTSISVDAQVPAFSEKYETLSSTPFTLVGEADTRIVSSSAAQVIAWTATDRLTNPCAAIIALYSIPPSGQLELTQDAREVLEQDGTVPIQLTQFAREVLYPFTCVPGPSNTPTPGCPEGLPTAPVAGEDGCVDEIG